MKWRDTKKWNKEKILKIKNKNLKKLLHRSLYPTPFLNHKNHEYFDLDLYLKKKGSGLFSISFDDGILNNIIEISSSVPIEDLSDSKLLAQYYFDKNEKKYNYKLSSNIKEDIQNIEKNYQHNESIISIDITYV